MFWMPSRELAPARASWMNLAAGSRLIALPLTVPFFLQDEDGAHSGVGLAAELPGP